MVEVPTEVVKRGEALPALNEVTVPVPTGRSVNAMLLKEGAPAAPLTGPKNAVALAWLFKVKERAGAVAGLATDVANKGDRFPELKVPTFPDPTADIVKAEAP